MAIDNARLYRMAELAWSREAAARRRAEDAGTKTSRLQAVATALSGAATPEEVADVIVHEGSEALGAAAALMATLRPDGETLEAVGIVGLPPAALERWRRYSIHDNTMVGEVARTRRAAYAESIEERVRRYPNLAADTSTVGFGAWAALPLLAGDRALGALGFAFATTRPFTLDDRAFMAAFADLCAQALERSRLYQLAVDANRAKSEFLSMMSHELRTPLTAIIGYQELLADGISGPVTERQAEHLGRIKLSAGHLLGLIDEVLTLSRLDAGRETLYVEGADVTTLVDEAVTLVATLAAAKGLPLVVRAPASPVTIESDVGKVRQILVNLLGNAVKYTDRGRVELSVREEGGRAVFRVRDTGIGIRPEHLDRIFEPFWRVEQKITRRVGGSGLGLSVSRRLARLLGGDVAAESVFGEGATFTLRLPLSPAAGSGRERASRE
jgi:signal transduction histidine kinase